MLANYSKPLFICVDGPDGSGKTTIINYIRDYLTNNFILSETMRALGQGPIGNACRQRLFIAPPPEPFEGLLLPTSIVEAYYDNVVPTLADNKTVLMDRWISSYYAYQVYGRQSKFASKMFESLFVENNILPQWPDLYFICNVDIDVANERLQARNETLNYLDTETRDFKERVNKGFKNFEGRYFNRVISLDCNKNLKSVLEDVEDTIKHYLKNML